MLRFLCWIGLMHSGRLSKCGKYFRCDYCGQVSHWQKGFSVNTSQKEPKADV